ncbi:MAG TPA: hypothetical protein VKX45_02750 [Bryobacteraceae bacterium]|nr:hypothetical protein [Bryobacteraceae bacterium]
MLSLPILAGLTVVALPAKAADSQLLNLVMPDATVLAGVNVDQAKTSSFGQYVLQQMQNPELQKLIAATGFDPTRDVSEVLVAAGAAGSKTGLALARGTFNPAQIAAAAAAHGGTTTETYDGYTIVEDQKQTHGVTFVNSTIAVAGDVASVKAALDRLKTPSSLPAAVLTEVSQWSGQEDAWVITTVPPSSLQPKAGVPTIPGLGASGGNNALQTIQSAAAGVKFGNNVVVTAQAQSDNAQDAQNLANTVKLLASVAQLQAKDNPTIQTLAQSLTATATGTTVNISLSMPSDQLQALLTHPQTHAHGPRKRM